MAFPGLCFIGDAFFKAAVSLLSEVPRTLDVDGKVRSTEPLILEYVYNFTSALLVVPVSHIIHFLCHYLSQVHVHQRVPC